MSSIDWRKRVKDIPEATGRIERTVAGMSLDLFASDDIRLRAVLYDFAIIGEAARSVGNDFQLAHPEIPWRDMQDMRNAVIHQYLGVVLDVVWDTIHDDLPKLSAQLRALLEEPE